MSLCQRQTLSFKIEAIQFYMNSLNLLALFEIVEITLEEMDPTFRGHGDMLPNILVCELGYTKFTADNAQVTHYCVLKTHSQIASPKNYCFI